MSDPKRTNLITVGVPKASKNNVTKTVRLTINLEESNESKYPELNYKELVIAEDRKEKERKENGKTAGLDPFSDNDDDVERVARKFEQKYGGKRTYGRKGRSKRDDFADIGAGYDENDSFIDNTDGYDEMFPPEVDTYLGGFYINCGLLEFKSVPDGQNAVSDAEPGNRRNKRRISSSSSEEDTSESSSECESQDEKEAKTIANGAVDSHKTEHRKKKNKNIEKKPKKIRRTDSSAATSGKQTSDDNAQGDVESDSRTSQSDSTSKPAPSSENVATSDSSRDVEAKLENKLPPAVNKILEDIEAIVAKNFREPNSVMEFENKTDSYIMKLERILCANNSDASCRRVAWTKAAKLLNVGRAKLLQKAKSLVESTQSTPAIYSTVTAAQTTSTTTTTTTSTVVTGHTGTTTTTSFSHSTKRKHEESLEDIDVSQLSMEQREALIKETLQELKELIEERKPGMMASYDAECERVIEERKKQQTSGGGGGAAERRRPKRRFPWCARSRRLLSRLRTLSTEPRELLAHRVLPLFPAGFVRMPTLLRQADLSKELKTAAKRQRVPSTTESVDISPTFTAPIQFPSSLTVTTATKPEKNDVVSTLDSASNAMSIFGSIVSTFSLGKDLVVEKANEKKKELVTSEKKEESYIPPNNIGSITITAVPNTKTDKKVNSVVDKQKEPLIRIKSPAALNEMVKKDTKLSKKIEKNPIKERRLDVPLHVDTTHQPSKKEPSPKSKAEEISQKQIENMRVAENNIPRPALVPVHHSPTFIKPDKRPPESKKKKDILIVSDFDPLGDIQPEPLAIDDSSSDVELIEDNKNSDKSELKCSESRSDSVPSKDKVSSREVNHKRAEILKQSSKDRIVSHSKEKGEDNANMDDIDIVIKNLREMEHSQETTKYSAGYGGIITNARHEKSSKQLYNSTNALFGEPHTDKDKLTNFFEQNGWI